MIKLFRKIRFELMSENKTGNYFKYAIGEIILVVIGILIALQINNWNNNRLDNQYEKQILLEIQKSLQNDLGLFKGLANRITKKDQAIDSLLLVRKGQLNLDERTKTRLIGWAGSSILFSYDKGAYEALKTGGVEKIKTDSLRNRLIRIYEVFLPRSKTFLDNIDIHYEDEVRQLNQKLKDLGLTREYFEPNKDSTGFYLRYKYDVDLIHDPLFEDYLLLHAKIKDELSYRLSYLVEDLNKELEVINKELEVRFNVAP